MEDETIENLISVVWINFLDGNDPISGFLDLYEVDKQILLKMKAPFGIAHIKYWEEYDMYKSIIEYFDNLFIYPQQQLQLFEE